MLISQWLLVSVSIEKVRVLARLKPCLTAAEKRLPTCIEWNDDTVTLTEPAAATVRSFQLFFFFLNGYFF